jgi:uncharacterized protein DUF222
MFVSLTAIHVELEALARDLDAAALSGAEALRALDELGVIRRLTDGLLAKVAKRVHDTSAYERSGARDAAHCYARTLGCDTSEARRAIETATKLAQLPTVDLAVREGRLSAQQAQMITAAASLNPDAAGSLVAAAAQGMVPLKDACIAARAEVEDQAARSQRQRAARSFRMWTADDGMVEGHFKLQPEVGGRVKQLVDHETGRVFRGRRRDGTHEAHDRYAADAFVELLFGQRRAKSTVTTHVVIDHAALVRGETVPGERCEIPGVGPVSVTWAREILGDSFLTAIIKKGRDIATVAHLGRHVPAEVQTAMIVGGRECDIEGCHNRGYLERDHCEIDYAKRGPTAWWNLTWLCSVHHRRKTKGWRLGRRDEGTGKRPLRPPGTPATAA